jgi:pimeloyl-ACP methyl ester carboxylesterase
MGYNPLPAFDRYEGVIFNLVSASNDLPWSLHRLRPRLPTVHLDSLGHWLMLDRPDDVNRELDRFLDAVRAHVG